MVTLARIIYLNPYLLIGILSLIGTLSLLVLKETLNAIIHDEIEELRSSQNDCENRAIISTTYETEH